LDHFDKIAAITPDDARFFALQTKKPVEAIPFGIDLSNYQLSTVSPEFPSLFHLGSMNWIPNEEGISWFLENVWPIVTTQHPDLKLYLAGRCMPAWLSNLQLKNVVILGEVDDAQKFMRSKAISVVPLLSGSGIRIKIIEAMALGRAVISTSLGAEGIRLENGTEILLADSPETFANAIDILVTNEERTLEIGKSARKRIESDYDNVTITNHFCKWLIES
jgi:glycosyltransferase involved in cell wall biosynthesis